jgi:hypothetical protein
MINMTLELKLRKVLSICISPALTLFTWKKKPNPAVIAAISFSLMAGLLGNIVFAPAARAATTTFNCDGGTYTVVDGVVTTSTVCTGDLTLDNSVTSIDYRAFFNARLTSLTLNSALTTIGEQAFNGNILTSLTIPANSALTTIGNRAFVTATLTSLTLNSALTTIDQFAFYGSTLSSLTLNDALTTIGQYAFRSSILTSLTLNSALTTIGRDAFYSSTLTSLTIPPNSALTTIGAFAFYSSPLSSLTLNDALTTIATRAFDAVSSTTLSCVNASVTTFALYPWAAGITRCVPVSFSSTEFVSAVVGTATQLTVTITETNSSNFGVVTPDGKTGNGYGDLSTSAIDHGITKTGSSCYPYTWTYGACTIIFEWTPTDTTPLSTSDTFTFQIYDNFQAAFSYQTITFTGTASLPPPCYTVSGTTLTSGSSCTGDVVISSGITSISNEAFLSNELITSVTIPDSVVTIGAQAFQQCPLLISVVLPSNITEIPFALFLGSPQLANIGAIPNRVTSIGEMAFKGTALTTLNIPNSVTTLGASFASDMSLLATVSFGSGITVIPSNAFAGSGSLQVVNIPANVTSIGSGAFLGSMGITSLTLPDTLLSIGSQAFDGAGPPNLTCVNASVTTFALYTWATGITRCGPPISTPTITSFSPSSGPTAGGTLLSITGTGFLPLARVYFGEGLECEDIRITATTITCKTPLIEWPDAYGVTVVNENGGYAVADSLFTYLISTPTITSFSPSSGSTAGGTRITITGTGFSSNLLSTVVVGEAECQSIVVVNSTTITCTTPAKSVDGPYYVNVINEDGGIAYSEPNEFTYGQITVVTPVVTPEPREIVGPIAEPIPEPKLTAITPIVEKQSNPYVTLNGGETNAIVQANTTQNGMEVVANGWGLSLAVIEPNGNAASLSPNRSLVLNEDQQVKVSGPGFKPNTEVHVYLFSTPRLIGTTTTDSNGNFVGIFPMLKDVAVGNHLIQVNGISPDNQVRSTTLPAIYEKAKPVITPTSKNLVLVVPFASNKYTLNASQMAILKSVNQVKATKIQVIGYAQPSAAQADIAISLDRALEVKKAVSKIVPQANFITRGSGPKRQPLCATYKNKCVVVTITQG